MVPFPATEKMRQSFSDIFWKLIKFLKVNLMMLWSHMTDSLPGVFKSERCLHWVFRNLLIIKYNSYFSTLDINPCICLFLLVGGSSFLCVFPLLQIQESWWFSICSAFLLLLRMEWWLLSFLHVELETKGLFSLIWYYDETLYSYYLVLM